MLKIIFVLLLLPFFNPFVSPNSQLDLVRINSPKDGDVLQGNVYIEGTISGLTFTSAEISFRYQDSLSSNWFQIETIDSQIVDDTLAIWDTSTIADGIYQLRIEALYDDGRTQETIVNNLNIRNYTAFNPITTSTPEIVENDDDENEPIITTTATVAAIPTPFPPNEMIISRSQFFLTMVQGAIFGILLLVVLLLFIIIRKRKIG
ncbi:MAG TPA: hypothetical protein VK856_02020 [Anaerolineaceae bacterium]|nr:hypothetical protein [Anaerolineaceae bacterium]